MRTIDGTTGGGQILRTALSLSMHTGEPVRIERIRAGRPKPGLQRQHLTALRAAEAVCSARVEGAAIGASTVTFRPRDVTGGAHEFHVGSAGSTGLVLQTILPALLTAPAPSQVNVRGGTHNAWAPPFDFLERTFLPAVSRMGPTCRAFLQRHGFYPAGGGQVTLEIEPSERLARITIDERGDVHRVRARVLVADIGASVAKRERRTLIETTGWPEDAVEIVPIGARQGPGNAILVDVETAAGTTVLSAFGRRGVRAEDIASELSARAVAFIDSGAPVDRHLADQLLLPMALAGGGSFRTERPLDDHATSNAALITAWLGLPIQITEESATIARVTVG